MQKIQNDRSFCIFCIYFLFAAVEGLFFMLVLFILNVGIFCIRSLLAPVEGLFFKPKYRANILYLF